MLNEGFRYRDLETGTFITRDPLGFIDGPNMYAYVVQNPWTKFDPQGLYAQVAAPLAPLVATPPGAVAAGGAVLILGAHEVGKAIADPVGQAIHEKFAQATGRPYLNADGQLVDPKGTGSLPDKNPPKVDIKQGEVTFIPAGATREDVEQFKKDREKGDPNAQEKLNQRVKERLNGGKSSSQDAPASSSKGARTEAIDFQEQLALDEAKAGAGEKYTGKLDDPKYDPITGTHDKMRHNHDHGDGTSTEVHYDVDRTTKERSGFKIKDDTNANSRGNEKKEKKKK